MTTAQQLIRRLEAVDRRRVALLDELQATDPALLVARPKPDKWSIREVVEHLVLTERYVLRGMPDPAELRASRRAVLNRLMYRIVTLLLRFGPPVPAPSKAMLPTGERSLAQLRDMWDDNHRWIRSYIRGLDPRGVRRAVFRHPITGPLDARHALRLLEVHTARHIRQIRRLQEVLVARHGAPRPRVTR